MEVRLRRPFPSHLRKSGGWEGLLQALNFAVSSAQDPGSLGSLSSVRDLRTPAGESSWRAVGTKKRIKVSIE
jgi:hypothetical protein